MIDQTYIKKIKKINHNKKYKFIIFIWNGSFDLKKFKNDIQEIKNQDIDFKLLAIGSFHNKDKYFIDPNIGDLNNSKKEIIIKNLSSKIKFIYQKSKIFSITKMIFYPLQAIKKLFFPKVIFYGFGKIRETELKNIQQNNISNNFDKIKNDYWQKLSNLENEDNSIDKSLELFESILINHDFENIEMYEKYYIFQNFFRHIFINICNRFENFEWKRFENKLLIYHSPFYNQNYYIDFGSKCSVEKIYSRYLFLKRYNKNILSINFFENFKNGEKNYKNLIKNSIEYLKEIKKLSIKKNNLSASKLYELLKANYNNINI